jgi:hypothetical protein
VATISSSTHTGKLNICLDCEYYTTIDKGAEVHSREKKHFVFQDMVTNQSMTAKSVQARREFLKRAMRE